MASDRAHQFSLVGVGSLRRPRRAASQRASVSAGVPAGGGPATQVGAPVGTRVVVRGTGRHRVGADSLRHCADLATVRPHLRSRRSIRQRARHRRRAPIRVTAQLITGVASVAASAVVLVSGWYAAAGAAAVVQMVAH